MMARHQYDSIGQKLERMRLEGSDVFAGPHIADINSSSAGDSSSISRY